MSWLEQKLLGHEAPADIQATLLALTGKAISSSILQYCTGAEEVYICGGGAHNQSLLAYLRQALPNCSIQLTDQLGIEADWLEQLPLLGWLNKHCTAFPPIYRKPLEHAIPAYLVQSIRHKKARCFHTSLFMILLNLQLRQKKTSRNHK